MLAKHWLLSTSLTFSTLAGVRGALGFQPQYAKVGGDGIIS